MTEEQREAYNAKRRERRANMTPEQKEARKQYYRNWSANRTEEKKYPEVNILRIGALV